MKKLVTTLLVLTACVSGATLVWACAGGDEGPKYAESSYIDPDDVNDFDPDEDQYSSAEHDFTDANKIYNYFYPVAAVVDEPYDREKFAKDYRAALHKILPVNAYPADDFRLAEMSSGGDGLDNDNYLCGSNTTQTALTLYGAAAKEGLKTAELQKLIRTRNDILKLCNKPQDIAKVLAEIDQWKKSGAAGKYPDYLEAITYFYTGTHDKALALFAKLADQGKIEKLKRKFLTPKPDWVRETSSYMLGRVDLIDAQAKWDSAYTEYEEGKKPENVDQALVDKAQQFFDEYLFFYPAGTYAQSVTGLKRKFLRLKNDKKKLDDSVLAAVTETITRTPIHQENTAFYDRLNEYRMYYRGEVPDIKKHNPLLVAAYWVGMKKMPSAVVDEISTSKDKFKAYPGLYDFLSAYALYKKEDYKAVIAATENIRIEKDLLVESRTLLRARAFVQLKEFDKADEIYRSLHSVTGEDSALLDIAFTKIAAGKKSEIFTDPLLQQHPEMERDFAMIAFSDEELETLTRSLTGAAKKYPYQELLRRKLMQKDFKSMDRLMAQNGPTGIFDQIRKDVADSSNDASLLNISKFILKNNINSISDIKSATDYYYAGDEINEKCGAPCENFDDARKRPVLYPYDLFKEIAENGKLKNIHSETDAEALHYVVMCFKPSSEFNSCRDIDSKDKTGKVWFDRLHTRYPNSPWSGKTPYYYEDPY